MSWGEYKGREVEKERKIKSDRGDSTGDKR